MERKLVLFQGDSITDAGRTSSTDEFCALGCGYPFVLSGIIGTGEQHQEYIITNKGISGNRVVDLYSRWKEDTLNLKPAVISILIGVNDVWHEYQHGSGVCAKKFRKVYSLLLEETKEALPDTKIVLCEPFILPIGEVEKLAECWEQEMKGRREIVKEMSQLFHTDFVPLQDMLSEEAERLGAGQILKDGVHPTATGHTLIAKQWIKYVSFPV